MTQAQELIYLGLRMRYLTRTYRYLKNEEKKAEALKNIRKTARKIVSNAY